MYKLSIIIIALFGVELVRCRPQTEPEGRNEKENIEDGVSQTVEHSPTSSQTIADNVVLQNFKNPVLEYLLSEKHLSTREQVKNNQQPLYRKITHSQTLLLPNNQVNAFNNDRVNHVNLPTSVVKTKTPMDRFWEYLNKNGKEVEQTVPEQNNQQTVTTTNTTRETFSVQNERNDFLALSQKVFLKRNNDTNEAEPNKTRIQEIMTVNINPAISYNIITYDKNGRILNSVTHFQPINQNFFEPFEPIFNQYQLTGPNRQIHDPVTREKEEVNIEKSHNNEQKINYSQDTNSMSGEMTTRLTISNKEKNDFIIDKKIESQQLKLKRPIVYEGPMNRQNGVSWPFASYFPIVINDPFLTAYNAFTSSMYNAFSSVVEYGPEADVCKTNPGREEDKPGSDVEILKIEKEIDKTEKRIEEDKRENLSRTRRETKEPKSTDISIPTKDGTIVTIHLSSPRHSSKSRSEDNLNGASELIVRKGGVSIAGPGGAATAYTGGTAIVGPYGTVYKSPEGVAIAGPYSKIVNITDDMSYYDILKLHNESKLNKTNPFLKSLREVKNIQDSSKEKTQNAKFTSFGSLFSYSSRERLDIDLKKVKSENRKVNSAKERKVEDLSSSRDQIRMIKKDKVKVLQTDINQPIGFTNDTVLIFNPKSKAEAGRDGVAISAPTSHAVLYEGQKTNIQFQPESVASVGPAGFAHAHSDLHNLDSYGDSGARSRAHSVMLMPSIPSLINPEKFLDKKKKPSKPPKPNKEENEESEEVGEEEDSSNSQEGSDGVAISPPPEGASVAEARPIGLAIAGPGGVAAAKPQGTAVVGPGGLAIARPVGTAIAGVDVEGSIPIGGKKPGSNKKPPKQVSNVEDTELKYVGGLTGPIGNPRPKEMTQDLQYIGGLRGQVGNPKPRTEKQKTMKVPENDDKSEEQFLHNLPRLGYIGHHNGKYGFLPLVQRSNSELYDWGSENVGLMEPRVVSKNNKMIEKRLDNGEDVKDAPAVFFHGLLGKKDKSGKHVGLQQPLFYPLVYY